MAVTMDCEGRRQNQPILTGRCFPFRRNAVSKPIVGLRRVFFHMSFEVYLERNLRFIDWSRQKNRSLITFSHNFLFGFLL